MPKAKYSGNPQTRRPPRSCSLQVRTVTPRRPANQGPQPSQENAAFWGQRRHPISERALEHIVRPGGSRQPPRHPLHSGRPKVTSSKGADRRRELQQTRWRGQVAIPCQPQFPPELSRQPFRRPADAFTQGFGVSRAVLLGAHRSRTYGSVANIFSLLAGLLPATDKTKLKSQPPASTWVDRVRPKGSLMQQMHSSPTEKSCSRHRLTAPTGLGELP